MISLPRAELAAATLLGRAGAPSDGARPPFQERPRPLHVAFALGGTDAGRSGIGTYVREVLPPLIQQVHRDGGRVTAFGHEADREAFAAALAGAQFQPIPALARKPGLNALWHLVRGAEFARRLGADVLLLPAANRRAVAQASLPTVAVVHDLAQLRVPGKYDALRMFYFRQILLRALRRPTRLVAVSRATRDDLVQAVRVPPPRIDVVYNGVNTTAFTRLDPQSAPVRAVVGALGLSARPFLLYPARLEHPGKNHLRLLRAFARAGLGATHSLVLSGGDWGAGGLIRETIRALHLEHDVVLAGFVSPAQLAALTAAADSVVMLGLHEGFGLPALEALAAGRPVCVSSTGALPEVVGDLGVRCDPFDESAIAAGLRRVLADAALRDHCTREGPAWAAQFTWQRTASGLLAACRAAVAA